MFRGEFVGLNVAAAAAAAAEGKSLHQWVTDTLGDRVAPEMA